MIDVDSILYETIKKSGIDLLLSLPCIMLKGLLELIDEKKEIQHIPITREEEGVGIAAGAYLGGKTPAILMQNSGLGNSVNAIKSLLQLYKIPVVFIMSHRGAEGERILAQIPMGKLTPDLLDLLEIKKYVINSLDSINEILDAVELSKKTKISAIQANNNIDAGPIYLKKDLSLDGSAREIFARASKIAIDNMIPYIIKNEPFPIPQKGNVVPFKRRKVEDSNLPKLTKLNEIYDFIRMLDAEGYPLAYIENNNFKIEFSDAKLNNGIINCKAKIKKMDGTK